MSSDTHTKFEYSFAGKNVLVTGGGRGVGYTLVARLYNDGAVVYTLEKNPDLVAKLLQDFPDRSRLRAEVCDLTNWNETQTLIESFGAMDHLVNCAAITDLRGLLDVQEENVDSVFNINLKSLICTSQAVGKGMISAGIRGTIVNISSLGGHVASSVCSTYSISKAGVIMLTKCLAVELGKHGIRSNSISPTCIDSPMLTDIIQQNPSFVSKLMENSAMARQPLSGKTMLDKEDVVNSILFLLSPLSSLANGMDLALDGGILAC